MVQYGITSTIIAPRYMFEFRNRSSHMILLRTTSFVSSLRTEMTAKARLLSITINRVESNHHVKKIEHGWDAKLPTAKCTDRRTLSY